MAKKFFSSKGRAGLPGEVKFVDYPKQGYISQEGYYKDTIKGTDSLDAGYKKKLNSQMSELKGN